MISSEAVVAGAGPAGLVAALALADAGLDVVHVAPPRPPDAPPDTRTTALFGGSVELLRRLGVWARVQPRSAPLVGLRLVDDTGALLRAPEVLFEARELGLDAFGWNVENDVLVEAVQAVASETPSIRRLRASVDACRIAESAVELATAAGTVLARLVAAADGRESICRQAAGIAADRRAYPQSALAVRFSHSRPHDGISTELHRRAGPLTTVPLPGRRSSLVWVETPAEVARLAALAPDIFARELEERLHGLLGTVDDLGPRIGFPLTALAASPLAARRIALVGEAGHVVPPIGAQGLNLGFRDAAWLAEIAGRAVGEGRDPGGAAVTSAYDAARRRDVATRKTAVDLLNRSLVADLLPLDVARAGGLAVLAAIGPLRRAVMREGIEPSGALPRLLRPLSAD
jgi:2-octaprenyl-6-methoxyphenol hydroxylase